MLFENNTSGTDCLMETTDYSVNWLILLKGLSPRYLRVEEGMLKSTHSLKPLFCGYDDGATQRECTSDVRISTTLSSSGEKLFCTFDAFLRNQWLETISECPHFL